MDVSVGVLGGTQLNDQIDFWDVQSSGSDVGGHEALQTAFSESLKGDLSLFLGNISMKDLTFQLKIRIQINFVGLVWLISMVDLIVSWTLDRKHILRNENR